MRLPHSIWRLAMLAPAVLLSACGTEDNDPGPGGVSVGEARALDEAAEMIEARRLPPGAIATQDDAAGETDARPNAEDETQ